MSILGDASFARAFAWTVGDEGVLSLDPKDDGNWTGGKAGVGELRGTKYGISAKAFPKLDIAAITLAQARGIYWQMYWLAIRGPELPEWFAAFMFDAAVNQGRGIAVRCAQRALRVQVDGVLGPATLGGIRNAKPDQLLEYFAAERLLEYENDPTFATHGRGWYRRVVRGVQRATRLLKVSPEVSNG